MTNIILGILCMVFGILNERINGTNANWFIRWYGVWLFSYGMGTLVGVMAKTGMM